MDTETPLNVTPEESLEGLSAAVGGIEDERATQQPSDVAEGLVTSAAPPSSIETRPKVSLILLLREEVLLMYQ